MENPSLHSAHASTMGKFALVQFFETYPSATVLSHQTVRCAGSAGTLSFFKVSGGDKAPDAIQAQLLLQVGADHKTFAVMTLTSKAKFYDQVRPILESIALSVKTADPKKLDEYRAKLITQAKQWHAGINGFQSSNESRRWRTSPSCLWYLRFVPTPVRHETAIGRTTKMKIT